MSHSALAAGLRHLRGVVAAQQHRDDSDEQLLHAFAAGHDESAFATLVRRHGSMVLHVCRRVLGQQQDAEDAFQAAFLVLARNAGSLRKKSAVASFLHGTAYRLALHAKRAAARRRKHESSLGTLTQPRSPADPADDLSWREARGLLDEEIARLPEKYRSVFVLCCLEELSREEVGRRLGLKERTVLSRLAEARRRLRQRLARRGVELTAVLSATALAPSSASALPAGLMANTLQAASALGQGTAGLVSAPVAALLKSAASAAVPSKTKMIAVMLLIVSVLAGAGVWVTARPQAASQTAELPKSPVESKPQPPQAKNAEAPQPKKNAGLLVKGRVLGPDGKPVAGAKLYFPRQLKEQQQGEKEVEMIQRGTTDAKGRFRFQLPRTEIDDGRHNPLVAATEGFGVAWTELPQKDAPGELTLRLVKDVPIRGRLVSTEGMPVAGVTVTVAGILAFERLDDFLRAFQREMRHAVEEMTTRRLLVPLNSVLGVKSTDKDGRFEIRGIGVERVAGLEVNRAAGVEEVMLAVTREGFDAKAYLKSLLREPRERISPHLFGPSFEHIVPRAEANQVIEGTVREAGSGKAVAGATVTTSGATAATDNSMAGLWLLLGRKLNEADVGIITAVTDDRGHYRLAIKRKAPNYWLEIRAPEHLPLIGYGLVVKAPAVSGVGAIRADVEMRRGGVVTGRLYNKATGKGIPGKVHFVPLPENKSDGLDFYKKRNDLGAEAGADGRFRLVAIAGPGVLMARISDTLRKIDSVQIDPYKQAEFDAADHPRIKMNDPSDPHRGFLTVSGVQYLDGQHACKVLDIKEGGAVSCDLALNPVNTLTVHVQNAEGKPLAGAVVMGISAQLKHAVPLQSARCTIYALDPKNPRPVAFLHAERKLAAVVTLRGDEKEPVMIRLAAAGTLTGRVLDGDGHAVAGAEILVYYARPEGTNVAGFSLRDLLPRTDKEGRFHLQGIVPGLKVNLGFLKARQRLPLPPLNIKPLQSGQTLDLGDVRVKPAR